MLRAIVLRSIETNPTWEEVVMPPPSVAAVLSTTELRTIDRFPPAATPPPAPSVAVLLEMMLSVMIAAPLTPMPTPLYCSRCCRR
jgi:hypothetical protein